MRGVSHPLAIGDATPLGTRYPEMYSDYQRWHNLPRSYNAMVAAKIAKNVSEPAAQARSYQELVSREMAKGVNEVVAKQRVMEAYPDAHRDRIAKRDAHEDADDFLGAADILAQETGCSATEAMTAVRVANPMAFAKFQRG